MPYRERPGWSDTGEHRSAFSSFLRKLYTRSWYLVIPLIAVWWFDAQRVDPQTKAIEEEMAKERKGVEETRNVSLTRARKVNIRISALRAVGDTIAVRGEQAGAILDTIQTMIHDNLTEIRTMEVESDSLRTVYATATEHSDAYSRRLETMQARVDSLRALIEQRSNDIAQLETEIAATNDLADRLLHPEAYRKNSALVTGEGDFPNRDALPKR
ncbi:MAG: hypothetical protein ACE15D_05725 [Candidatus Eisenbacteria bacterium]|nr:hypothetical protein [Candidatus Eisenbacteria bacterium]